MIILELRDFAADGVFFEDVFDERFRQCNWSRFDGQAVRVSNCGLTEVPGWVYLAVGIELAGRARKIFFGDVHNPRKLFSRESTVTSHVNDET
jgi:hypothetical protein